MPLTPWSLIAVALALPVGLALAWLSYRLPRWIPGEDAPPEETPTRRRARWLGLPLACLGVALWAAAHHQGAPTTLMTAALGWALVVIATVDGEHFWLPDGFTLPLIGAGLLAAWLTAPQELVARSIGAVAGFVTLAVLAWAYRRGRGREGLGGGDPRLFAGAGAWVGWLGLPSVLVWASAAAFSVIAARLIVRRKVSGADRLPFGVFLAVGLWLTWLYGPLGI